MKCLHEMRLKRYVFAVIWIGCAIFNFGAINAQVKYDLSEKESRRDALAFIAMTSCLVPPLQLIIALGFSNFCQHGWTLENWKATPTNTLVP